MSEPFSFSSLRQLPLLLRPFTEEEQEDLVAFDRYATELTAQLAIFASALMIVVTLAWWPIDYLVQPDPRFVPAFAALRMRALVVEVVTLVLFVGSAFVRRQALLTAPLAHASLLFSCSYSLGQLGGPELSWFADSFIGVLPSLVVPHRIRARLAATLLLAASLPAGFFLPFPHNFSAPTALGQLSFLVFAALFTAVTGELVTRVQRRAFHQQHALQKANERLETLTSSLTSLVAEQTQELRSLAQHLEGVQESERRRIARDLHDDLGQSLTAVRFTLARLETRVKPRPEIAALVDDLGALVEAMSTSLRGIVTELRPRVLDELGLVAAAEWLAGRVRALGSVECTLEVAADFPDGERPEPELALPLFRVLQEATTNALKHAGAKSITLSLQVVPGAYTASVIDDGCGFQPEAISSGFGLLGLRERLRSVGGTLQITSSRGQGTRVLATVPEVLPPSVSKHHESTVEEPS